MIRHKLVAMLLFVVFAVVWGCTDRGTNVPTRFSTNGNIDPNRNSPIANPSLNFQVLNPEGLLQMSVYAPLDAFGSNRKPLPLLVLLAPENGGKFYYTDHGIVELAEELIANGEIQQLVIAMVGNDQIFGGYFYGNSFPGGTYDSVLGSALFAQLELLLYPLIDASNRRAIGGIGQGAYGAFRSAISHPGYYGAVVTGDGPLDFDGSSGSGGLISLFADVFTEQGVASGDASIFSNFDSSSSNPVSQYLIGGALAFSPHDTGFVIDTVFIQDTIVTGDTVVVDVIYSITSDRNAAGFVITDSSTLVNSVLSGTGSNDFDFDFHMPFNVNAGADATIWPLWMANNLDALEAANSGALASTNCWVGTTREGSFGAWKTYGDQTRSWVSTLRGLNVNVTSVEYEGAGGNPATRDEYIYDLMREMLIYADSSTFSK